MGRLCEVLGEAKKWLSDPTEAPLHILEPHICLECDFRRWLVGPKYFHFGLRNHLGGRWERQGGPNFDFDFDFLVLGRLCEVLGEAKKWLSDPTEAPLHILEPHICLECDFRRWLVGPKYFHFGLRNHLGGRLGEAGGARF